MYLYRVQHRETGVGPYQTNLAFSTMLCCRHTFGKKARPAPNNDGLRLLFPAHYLCAMPSLESLLWWFEGFHSRLDHYGFEIVKIRAPKRAVKIGKTQVMFDPALSTIVKHFPIPVKRRRP